MQNKNTLPTANALCIHFNAGKGQACHISTKIILSFLTVTGSGFNLELNVGKAIDILVVNQYSREQRI